MSQSSSTGKTHSITLDFWTTYILPKGFDMDGFEGSSVETSIVEKFKNNSCDLFYCKCVYFMSK